jgi:glycolate oxidase
MTNEHCKTCCFFRQPAPAIGGNVATNAGGIKGAKYGTTRDYVLGLQVVLPSGEVMHTGSYTMKCVSGYDLAKLFIGAEGTLGVITEVTLKINPLPRHAMTAMPIIKTPAAMESEVAGQTL